MLMRALSPVAIIIIIIIIFIIIIIMILDRAGPAGAREGRW